MLMLTPQVPHPSRQGAAIRNWNLCAELSKRHTVDVLSFSSSETDPAGTKPSSGTPWHTLTAVAAPRRSRARRLHTLALSRHADMADRLWSPRFLKAFTALLGARHYDIVQAEGIELGRYLLAQPRSPSLSSLLVFDDHNAEHLLQLRAARASAHDARQWPLTAYSLLQAYRLRALEGRLLARCDTTLCVSREDAAALRRLAPAAPLVVAPNGVDAIYYAPQEPPAQLAKIDLLFSGTLDYRPNVDAIDWFARQVWPRLRPRFPELRVALVGRNPALPVRDLARQHGFLVTGAVDDDRPYYAAASVYMLPMRFGGGVRLKLLNALAMECAVVTTSAGREGTAAMDGTHLLVADAPADFAAQVDRLLGDARLRARLGAEGRAYVRQHHNWADAAARVEAGYSRAFNRRETSG